MRDEKPDIIDKALQAGVELGKPMRKPYERPLTDYEPKGRPLSNDTELVHGIRRRKKVRKP